MAEYFHLTVGVAELIIGGHVTVGGVTYLAVWARNRRAPGGKHRA
jgi:hypothetical protein